MQFDLDTDLSRLVTRTYDFCVVGTGPAGITVARHLAAAGKSVALLEAGGLERSERSQAVYAGKSTGLKTWNAIESCRLRYFGGTSNHWSGQCGVFDESNFRPERQHELPGWPIERQELLARLPEALEIVDLANADFTPQPVAGKKASRFIHPQLRLSPPTRFGTKYRKEIADSKRIDLFLNANLVDLTLAAGGASEPRVTQGTVRNYARETGVVKASRFVLATGSIENARILLNSNRQVAAGIGNHSDFVGRCFMEHLNVQIGRFVVLDKAFFKGNGIFMSPGAALTSKLNIGGGILALAPSFTPSPYGGRLAGGKTFLRDQACEFDTVKEFARKFVDFNCSGEGVITSLIEQAPDRNSRVTLDSETDAFGLRRAHLNWVINDADRRTIRTLGFELARDLLELDVARVKLSDFITDTGKDIELINHCHQMGTTRMSKDPKFGVVDTDCRVHGVGNLYVAGSSVFPTGGGTNPTLTLVMLALRLGQHLSGLGGAPQA
jgi:choline dehydrogenase-like flavoprotein